MKIGGNETSLNKYLKIFYWFLSGREISNFSPKLSVVGPTVNCSDSLEPTSWIWVISKSRVSRI